MFQLLAGMDAGKGLVRFERHCPEQTLLYNLVEQYYPDFEMQWASEGRVLSDYVRREFNEYRKCGRLEHGFLRVQCETCHAEHILLVLKMADGNRTQAAKMLGIDRVSLWRKLKKLVIDSK